MTETLRRTAAGLSCLTANLPEALTGWPDPVDRVARSIRLAVRADLAHDTLAFSHHRDDLSELPDGQHLAYRGCVDEQTMIGRLQTQIDTLGVALVVTYAGAMPWSLAHDDDPAPHLVALRGYESGRWHVIDAFSALLPRGEQQPFDGWVSTADLRRAMSAPAPLNVEHWLRLQHALGGQLLVPGGARFRWLAPAGVPNRCAPNGIWRTATDPVLRRLSAYFEQLGDQPRRERFIDDLWAAAQHHTFRYAQALRTEAWTGSEAQAADAAVHAWNALPMTLRFAAEAARRGRSRAAMVSAAFDAVRTAEARCADQLTRAGYGSLDKENAS